MYKTHLRSNILTVAIAIILASVAYSAVLLKTNQDIIRNSKSSILIQQINAQELSTALGNLQLEINRYIFFRRKSTLDSITLYEKAFRIHSATLYRVCQQLPELKKTGELVYNTFPTIMQETRENLEKLPPKITTNNAAEIFDSNGNVFSTIWVAIDYVRSYQIRTIKSTTNKTIDAGSWSWNISVFGSIFMLVVVLGTYIYIKSIYKSQTIAEAKEIASEAKRKENERLLQAVIDNSTALIFLKDKSSRYTLANKYFRQLLGLEDEDILGKTHDEVFGKEHPEHVSSVEESILATGQVKESTEKLVFGDRTQYYLTTKFPLFDAKGEIFGLAGISTEITERREHEQELTTARELAEAAKISQQRFLANMSHEIRTPMNGVIGMTNLLESTPLNEEQEDYVKVIRQSSNILMLLINDILDVSKMQAGMLKLEKILFEVREFVKQIQLSYKPLANEMNISLSCDVDRNVPEFLLGDPFRFNQIISNLVNNAIKFTSSGGVSIKVTATEKERGISLLKVAVTDTGIGIPENMLDQVFNSFTQSSTSTTRKYGGTGLGLAIVKELVEMQGGNVKLESELNIGSTFTVTIPFEVAVGQKNLQQKNKNNLKYATLENKRILVVEDNLINQKVARQILLKAGFKTVHVADNGFIALDILEKEVYDAVLMDVQMPEIDGLETTRRIRSNLKLTVPIVALTASALAEDREICFAAGMNDYITKPFVPEDLLQKLSALLKSNPNPVQPDASFIA